MSTTIDQKVVEMRFDNRQFEQNVSQTMSSINKLNNSLAFKGSTKGFEGISDASQQTSKSLEDFEYTSYKTGFRWSDVLSKISSVAEWRIAQGAVIALENSLKSLGDQLLGVTAAKAGFSEYELKMGSVQTIMASTGESLETVNGYLNELNEYSDKTIYSFSDMTQNIGKFTNAGVSLKDSVAAIQGVANVAALSGANSNEASRAMYNFSQALSAGYVKLIDWKSIENANMATVGFKEELIKTALEMGTITKTSDGMYKTLSGKTFSATKNFNEVLQEQWMTSDVLTKTLANYADESTEIGKKATQAATEVKTFSQMMDTLKESAQSGWAQTWETIFGDFEEGKALWTDISNVVGGFIDSASKARNEMLENWKVMGGRDDLIQSFKNIFEGILSIVKPIKEAFTDIFPPMTSERLYELTEGFKEFTSKLKLSEDASDNLKRVFKGIFAIFDIAINIFSAVGRAIGSLFGVTGDLCGGVLGVAAAFGDALVGIRDFIVETDVFYKAFQFVANIIKVVISVVARIANAVKGAFYSGPLDGFIDTLASIGQMLADLFESTGSFGDKVKEVFGNLGEVIQGSLIFKILTSLWNAVKSVASGIAKAFGGAFKGIASAFAEGDLVGAFELINTLLSGGVLVGLGALIKKVSDIIKNFSEEGGALSVFEEIIQSVQKTLSSFTDAIKAQTLKTIASAVVMLVAALFVLTFIDKEKLATALAAITLLFTELMIGMRILAASFSNVKGLKDAAAMAGAIKSITSIAFALLLMTAALAIIGNMEMDTITRGLIGIAAVLVELVAAQILLSKLGGGGKKMEQGAKSLRTMAFTLLLISLPLYIIGSMDVDTLKQGVIGIAGVLSALVTAQIMLSKLAGGGKKMKQGAASLLLFVLALNMIIPPLLILGFIPFDVLKQGALGMTAVLSALAGVQIVLSKMAGGGKKMLQGAASLLIMVLAVDMVIPPLLILGMMNPLALLQGVIGITAVLASLAGAQIMLSKLAGGGKKLLQGAASVAIMMAAISMAVPMLLILGAMDTLSLIQGALGITAIAAALAGAQIMLSKLAGGGKKALQGPAAVAIIAASLSLIIPVLYVLGTMDTGALIQGILGMTVALAALAGVQIMLTKLAGGGKKMLEGAAAIVILAAAVALLVPSLLLLGSVGIVTIGVGLIALAGAFVVLGLAAMVLTPLAPTLMTVAGALALIGVTVLATGVGLLVFGNALTLLSAGLIAFVGAMGVVAGSLAIVAAGITALVAAVIAGIIQGIGKGIVALCEVLIECIPVIGEALIVIITELCRVLVECAPVIVDTILTLIVELLRSLADFAPMIVGELVDLLIGILRAVAERIPDIAQVIVDILFGLIQGVINALGGMDTGLLLEALMSVGMLTAIVAMLAAIAVIAPAAMVGVLGLAAIAVEMAALLAIFGGLAKIPGINEWLSGGGDLLQTIGTGIGQFIGGLIGGVAQGATSSLPTIAENLSAFMENVGPFIEGAGKIDASVLDGIGYLSLAILAMTGASLLTALASMITGGMGFQSYIAAVAALGTAMSMFSTNAANVDTSIITAAAEAAGPLTVAVLAMAGTSIITALVGMLGIAFPSYIAAVATLGTAMSMFSKNASEIDPTIITSAADAAGPLTTAVLAMTGTSIITALVSLMGFAFQSYIDAVATLGTAMSSFSKNAAEVDPAIITAAAEAAGPLTVAVLAMTGASIITALAAMLGIAFPSYIGAVAALGTAMSSFSKNAAEVDTAIITAAADAAGPLTVAVLAMTGSSLLTALATMVTGGLAFASYIGAVATLGTAMSSFSKNASEIDPAIITAAADAAGPLTTAVLAMTGTSVITALTSMVTGGITLASYLGSVKTIGASVKAFSDSVKGVDPSVITAAASAANDITVAVLAMTGAGVVSGLAAIVSGGLSVAGYKSSVKVIGEAVSGFYEQVKDIDPAKTSAAASAAKDIAEVVESMPADVDKCTTIKDCLAKVGEGIKSFYKSVSAVGNDAIATSNSVVDAISKLNSINAGNIDAAASAISEATSALKGLSSIPKNVASEFKAQLTELGETSAKDVLDGFKDLDTELEKIGTAGIESFISGFETEIETAKTTAGDAATGVASAMEEEVDEFSSAGKYLVQGFANGISANTYLASAKAKAMAAAAAEAAKKELDEHSPSKVGYEIGDFFGIAFVNAIGDNVSAAYDASSEMAGSAKSGLGDAISKISKAIDGDMDVQPTIRPVLDLSDIRDGADSIASMFGFGSSIGVLGDVNAINSMMNKRNQNGANDDVVSAIDKLHEDMKNMEHATYNINGVAYGEGTEVAEAIETLVRAIKIGGRT